MRKLANLDLYIVVVLLLASSFKIIMCPSYNACVDLSIEVFFLQWSIFRSGAANIMLTCYLQHDHDTLWILI